MSPPTPTPRLYAIADLQVLGEQALPAAVGSMARAGVGWIQLRAKQASGLLAYRLAESCLRQLEGQESLLWINDRVDVAAVLPEIAGVHLGQTDLLPAQAREILGEGVWIGQSTHSLDQVRCAAEDPSVDLLALGPIFPTHSKADPDPVVGLDTLRQARALTSKPLVAIGGIDGSRLSAVIAAGADSAAVLGAVCRGDVDASCRQLLLATQEAA